jgi:parallel beta-helix repeat protein
MKRIISGIIVTLLLISMLTWAFNIQSIRAVPTIIIVPDNYPSIQAAINHASQGDTLFIRNGTYYEHIVVNKSITIQGESKYFTVIEGNNTGDTILIESSNVKISELRTVNGYYYDVRIDAANSAISNCILTGFACISVNSNQNAIIGNLLDNCTCAIFLSEGCQGNTVIGNTVSNCQGGSRSSTTFVERFTSGNLIYHNNFIHDRWYWANQIGANNTWYDNKSCEGNYWDNLLGYNDTNGDGIIDGWNGFGVYGRDYYPLTNPYWCPADVNHDLKVDILDVVKICAGYGSTPSNSNWNPHADIAQPYGKIDILDVVLCTSSYGEKYR